MLESSLSLKFLKRGPLSSFMKDMKPSDLFPYENSMSQKMQELQQEKDEDIVLLINLILCPNWKKLLKHGVIMFDIY